MDVTEPCELYDGHENVLGMCISNFSKYLVQIMNIHTHQVGTCPYTLSKFIILRWIHGPILPEEM